jgi:2-keto-4-pentenoate hydratase/2-oxohepta-3-ene-1,7-dioic acid hydratase in catechol pathway
MLFPVSYLVSYISTFTELSCGDLIATGTPTGAGVRQEPPCYLVPGDLVEVEVSGLGILSNMVADEN